MKIFVTLLFFMMFPVADAVAEEKAVPLEQKISENEMRKDFEDYDLLKSLEQAIKKKDCSEVFKSTEKIIETDKIFYINYYADWWTSLFLPVEERGKCFKENPERAFKTVHNLAVKGGIWESVLLYYYYDKGLGTKSDKLKGAQWLRRGLYRTGSLSKEKREKILAPLKNLFDFFVELQMISLDSMEIKNPWIKYNIGRNLFEGTNGYPKDAIAACDWLYFTDARKLPQSKYLLYQMSLDYPKYRDTYFSYKVLKESALGGYSPAATEYMNIWKEKKEWEKAYAWFWVAKINGTAPEEEREKLENKLTEQTIKRIRNLAIIQSLSSNLPKRPEKSAPNDCKGFYNPDDLLR